MAPEPSFDDVVAAVQARAWWLRCRGPGAGVGSGWERADRLAGDPARLAGLIGRTGAARGADRASVAAALFVQAYTFQVAGMAVGAWALGLPSPSLDPADTLVRVGPERPDDLAVATTALVPHTARSLTVALLDRHLEPLVLAVRTVVRVGERALWGNVAASVAAVMRSVDGPGPEGDPGVRARAAELVAGHRRLGQHGTWLGPSADPGWRWMRRSCCLWFRTAEADGRCCDDCTRGRR